jgi:hypothetical protein
MWTLLYRCKHLKGNVYDVFLELFNVGLDLRPSDTQSFVLFNCSFTSELPSLVELHMTNMPNLTYIASGAMSKLITLREVYLSHNPHLVSIHPHTFSSRRNNEESEEWPTIIKVSVMWHILKYELVYVLNILFFISHGLFLLTVLSSYVNSYHYSAQSLLLTLTDISICLSYHMM